MPLEKLNDKGEFTYFPGVTVISKVLREDNEIWTNVYELLNSVQIIKDNYALLPISSYHFTSIYLYNNRSGDNESWSDLLRSHSQQFIQLSKAFESKFIPKPEFIFKSIIVDGVIQIALTPVSHEYDEYLKTVAKKFGLEDRVPAEFHITLAYQYKPLSHENTQQILTTLMEKLVRLFHLKMGFHTPQLCYFDDMTKFNLWDGDPSILLDDEISEITMKM